MHWAILLIINMVQVVFFGGIILFVILELFTSEG